MRISDWSSDVCSSDLQVVNAVLLNNIDHRDLRVDARRGARFGDRVMSSVTFPAEFRSVQAHYPIVFRATDDDSFQPIALFGLRDGENLFLDGDGWDATCLSLAVERQPFLIGKAEERRVGEECVSTGRSRGAP